MLRRRAARLVLGVALACVVGCTPASPSSPQAPPSAAPPVAAPSSPASPSAPASAPAAAIPPPPPPVPADWTHYTHPRLGLSFAYPKSVFHLTEAPSGVVLASTLARDELGGDPHPARWVFALRVIARPVSAEDSFKGQEPVWFDAAFPHGVFTPQEGTVRRTRLAGLEGYELTSGIEGYNRDVLFLERGPASALVLEFDTVGDVMGPTPPEAEQERLFEILRGSITLKSSGPTP